MAFKIGYVPWNKGKKGTYSLRHSGQFKIGNHPKTEFKKGHAPLQKGKNHWNWKNGIRYSLGYVYILIPTHPFATKKGYVYEHRIVVEKAIGKYLDPKNEVHHLGERNDNRSKMLMAFTNKSAHQRFEKNKLVKPEEIIFDGRKHGKN